MQVPRKVLSQTQPSSQPKPLTGAQPPPQVPGAGAAMQVPSKTPSQTQPAGQLMP